jgi:hypothetical protein
LFITCVGTHPVLRLDPKSRQLTGGAGNGRRGYSGDGGAARDATLNEPYEVRFDSRGNMLILEMLNHVLRKVMSRSGTISTIRGEGAMHLAQVPAREVHVAGGHGGGRVPE